MAGRRPLRRREREVIGERRRGPGARAVVRDVDAGAPIDGAAAEERAREQQLGGPVGLAVHRPRRVRLVDVLLVGVHDVRPAIARVRDHLRQRVRAEQIAHAQQRDEVGAVDRVVLERVVRRAVHHLHRRAVCEARLDGVEARVQRRGARLHADHQVPRVVVLARDLLHGPVQHVGVVVRVHEQHDRHRGHVVEAGEALAPLQRAEPGGLRGRRLRRGQLDDLDAAGQARLVEDPLHAVLRAPRGEATDVAEAPPDAHLLGARREHAGERLDLVRRVVVTRHLHATLAVRRAPRRRRPLPQGVQLTRRPQPLARVPAAARAHLDGQRGLPDEAQDVLGHRVDVLALRAERGAHALQIDADLAEAGGDDGQPRREPVEHAGARAEQTLVAEAVGQHRRVRVAVVGGQLRRLDPAREVVALLVAAPRHALPEPVVAFGVVPADRAARGDEAQLRRLCHRAVHRLVEEVGIAPGVVPAAPQQDERVRGAARGAIQGRQQPELLVVDRVGDRVDHLVARVRPGEPAGHRELPDQRVPLGRRAGREDVAAHQGGGEAPVELARPDVGADGLRLGLRLRHRVAVDVGPEGELAREVHRHRGRVLVHADDAVRPELGDARLHPVRPLVQEVLAQRVDGDAVPLDLGDLLRGPALERGRAHGEQQHFVPISRQRGREVPRPEREREEARALLPAHGPEPEDDDA